jgi:SH3-like domain-containing protein
VALVLILAAAGAACDRKPKSVPTHDGRPTPSGLPVPRYVSLKFDEVNARGGPGDDYKLLWVYRTRGLPLQVVAETRDWRRVCDPEGGVAWVHRRTVDSARTAMRTLPEPLPVSRSPRTDSVPVATLAGRALATLDVCRGGWCQIDLAGRKGWVKEGEIWGSSDQIQCR